MSIDEIQTELDLISTAIARITSQPVSSFAIQGRQNAYEGAGKLEALYKRQQYLETQLARLQSGGRGIRVRSGVPGR